MGFFKRSGYWQDVSGPGSAIADFVTVFRQAGTHRWRIAAVSAGVTFAIFSMMWQEGGTVEPRPPQITWITTFAPDRNDAQILASNRANQRVQDRLTAEQAKREADVRNLYKDIGRATGMDVDDIERKARADAAQVRADREAAAKRAAAAVIQQRAFAKVGRQADGSSTNR